MILVNTGSTTITKTWYVDGTATDAGTVTIGITDADGTEIVAPLTAVTDNADGTYEYVLAVQNEVKVLTVTWTVGTQSQTDLLEITGGWLFTESEIRTFQNSDFSDAAVYSDAAIGEIRDAITKEFEQICGAAFVPSYRRQVLKGTGGRDLSVARPLIQAVIACTIGSTTVTGFSIDELLPLISRTGGTFSLPTSTDPRNVTISYRHGHASVPPDIKQAALLVAADRLKSNVAGTGIPARASSWTDPSGSYQTFGPSAKSGRWYGMGSVDVALVRHNLNVLVS